jgi:sugar lactone lactonase YvrE
MVSTNLRTSPRGLRLPAFVAVAAVTACSAEQGAAPPPAAPQAAAAPAAPVAAGPAPVATTVAAPAAPAAPALEAPLVLSDGFQTPESVLYDPEQDVYFVSNIEGNPAEVDGKAFISKVTPDGKVDLKWIDGSKKGTTLNAPKGLGIVKGTLYVSDINFVRLFDVKTGAPKGKIAAPGATFLNDIAVAPDGTIYVSDSGIKPGKDGFEPTGTDAIYKIGKKGTAEKLVADKQLAGPNGLLADDKGVWAVTFGSNELYHVGTDGKKEPSVKLPAGKLDGIVKTNDGSLLVTSWELSAILKGTPGGTFEPLVKDVKGPADIGYDSKRNVLLIPSFLGNSVLLQKLPASAPAQAAAMPSSATLPPAPANPEPKPAATQAAPAAPAAAPLAAPAKPVMAPGPAKAAPAAK